MRIAVVSNFFPPRPGGSSHLSESLARHYVAAGHEVLVITAEFEGAASDEIVDGVRIVRLPARRLPAIVPEVDFDIRFAAGIRNAKRLTRLLDRFAPDVIHQHGQFFDLTWMSSVYARRRKVPVLLSVHTRLESTKKGIDVVFRCLDTAVVWPFILAARPDVVVMDRPMLDYIRSRYRIPSGRQVAIPVGVDPVSFRKGDRDPGWVRERWGIEDGPLVVSIGHVIALRDRVDLVRALPELRRRHPGIKVVVVGDVHYPRFLEVAHDLGVTDAIVCVGAVPRHEVADYLAAADVEVHDLQGLGLGTASLEAMLAEVPVVAALRADNFPGIDLISGENITIVPVGDIPALADAVDGLLSDPDRAAAIAKEQRRLVEEHFAIDVVAQRHLQHFEEMLARVGR
jgi:glycosyltransferase involved in cell wall biosynthesis